MVLGFFLLLVNCKEEDPFDYEMEYQDGYPNVMTGYWKAMDFEVVGDQVIPIDESFYDLITALDPNNKNTLVIDNIYNSNIRVRSFIDRTSDRFYVTKGEQLEKNNILYDIKTVSINGEYIDDPQDGELLYIETGLYDEYDDLYDTLIILAFRKTGFEDIEEYEYDWIFDE